MTSTTPPSIGDLFQRYLRGETAAASMGLGIADSIGDVIPHDAAPIQPIDPRQAWDDARAAFAYFPDLPSADCEVPPDWSAFLAGQPSTLSLPFCVGNSPQFVRDVQPLLAGQWSSPTTPTTFLDSPAAIRDWAVQMADFPQGLIATGVLRLLGDFDRAAEKLAKAPSAWRSTIANEEAALLWHRGQLDKARDAWQRLDPSIPVLFNCGMAALFLNDKGAARKELTLAVEGIAETSPWHHLGRIYLTLAG